MTDANPVVRVTVAIAPSQREIALHLSITTGVPNLPAVRGTGVGAIVQLP